MSCRSRADRSPAPLPRRGRPPHEEHAPPQVQDQTRRARRAAPSPAAISAQRNVDCLSNDTAEKHNPNAPKGRQLGAEGQADAEAAAEPEIEVPEEVETALEQLFGSLQDKVGIHSPFPSPPLHHPNRSMQLRSPRIPSSAGPPPRASRASQSACPPISPNKSSRPSSGSSLSTPSRRPVCTTCRRWRRAPGTVRVLRARRWRGEGW